MGSFKSFFGLDEVSPPNIMQMPQAPKASAAQEESAETLRKRRRAMEKSQTIFTDPLGIGGDINIIRKKLLGQ